MFAHSFLVFNDDFLREALDPGPRGSLIGTVLLSLHLLVLVILALYGLHRMLLVGRFAFSRNRQPTPLRRFDAAELPGVTIQLPLFNELYVTDELLDSVAKIEWPRDRLQIQVLDDSTDETCDVARAAVQRLAANGLDIQYIHRVDRTGFKAGALENGLKTAKYDLIAIFDADFRPHADFLHRIVHYFTDERVGVAQARWGHLNEDQSLLTKAQALMLDGHFLVEHPARNRTGFYFNFNGTGGIWRRQAIEDAGGWDHDTLTEDLDLSYRAQMKGWKFVYDPSIVCPAELPVEMNAFKSQQHRWAKGSVQVMIKLLRTVLSNPVVPRRQKVEAFFHLTANLCYLLMIPVCLLTPVMVLLRSRLIQGTMGEILDWSLMAFTTGSLILFYAAAQLAKGKGSARGLWVIPVLMAVGMGMAVNQAKAVFEAVIGRRSAFVRTPKFNVVGSRAVGADWKAKRYRGARNWIPWLEIGFAGYFALSTILAISVGAWLAAIFLTLFTSGFAYVGGLSIHQRRERALGAGAEALETASA